MASAQAFESGLAGYACTAATTALGCGTSGANGSVGLAPGGGTRYGWVSTIGGSTRNPLEIAGTSNGSTLTSSAFTATAGQLLSFNFNFITSDGTADQGLFPDYSYVRLIGGGQNLTLFTARTIASGNTVPGFGLPGLAPGVFLNPSSTPIISGAPNFSPLGTSSGGCYGAGCGTTGWITAWYAFGMAGGTYQLEFNVFNNRDNLFNSALAFDYALGAGGTPTVPNVVPEPSTYLLMASGLASIAALQRRRRA